VKKTVEIFQTVGLSQGGLCLGQGLLELFRAEQFNLPAQP
jgi:hypothetical protein